MLKKTMTSIQPSPPRARPVRGRELNSSTATWIVTLNRRSVPLPNSIDFEGRQWTRAVTTTEVVIWRKDQPLRENRVTHG